MVFEYVSDSLDLVESFWRFFVPEHNISIPFVMVGHTFEPALSFDRSHINFREMLLGKGTAVNPLSPSINMQVLLTLLHIFLTVLVGRICSNIKTPHL